MSSVFSAAEQERRYQGVSVMKWSYWLALYLRTHCGARGLSALSIAAYEATLRQFRGWCEARGNCEPDTVTAREGIENLEYLRRERVNGAAAVNRTLTSLLICYREIAANRVIEPRS